MSVGDIGIHSVVCDLHPDHTFVGRSVGVAGGCPSSVVKIAIAIHVPSIGHNGGQIAGAGGIKADGIANCPAVAIARIGNRRAVYDQWVAFERGDQGIYVGDEAIERIVEGVVLGANVGEDG